MNSIDIQDKLKILCDDKNSYLEFVFKLLEIYSFPKTTILKLKKEENQQIVKLKNKLYFKETTLEEDEHVVIDTLSKDREVLKLNPRFIVVTDYENFVAIDTRKSIEDSSRTLDVKISNLYKRFDFFAPWLGIESYQVDKETVADIRAASKMAKLYDQIINDNPNFYKTDSKDLNLLLSRLLFCFFAEDTGIFEKNIFTNSILSNSDTQGENLTSYIGRVFEVFNIEKTKRNKSYLDLDIFPYVNGGLFKDTIALPKFTKKSRDILEECGNLEWSEINPDIFGSMIQAVIDPNQRENLGMHYTSVPNIMKLIRPLFLDDLYEEYYENISNKKKLEELRKRISKIKIFDPACGSGNFLIISYKELCKLEALILKQLIGDNNRLDLEFDESFSSLTLNNFYGIEIDDFAHDVTRLSLYLAQHQVNVMFEKEFGKLKPILPLRESGNIVCGNSARIDWEKVCLSEGEIYIVGNPPYYGSNRLDDSQREDVNFSLKELEKRNKLDYISIWFYKASKYSSYKNIKFAFVTTNSISQGEQASVIWPEINKLNMEIFFAYQSFKWENNAKNNAAVTVVIIGLRNLTKENKFIYFNDKKIKAANINYYLMDAPNVMIESKSRSFINDSTFDRCGYIDKSDSLFFDKNTYNDLQNKYGNKINPFIKRIYGAQEMLNNIYKYSFFIPDDKLSEAIYFTEIKNAIKKIELIRDDKLNSHKFSKIDVSNKNILVVPRVSSENRNYIPISFLNNSVVNDSVVFMINPEMYIFGIVSSRMHMVWVRAIGGKLKTDIRYSSSLCYNTFPFPKITEQQKQIITNQVYNILDEREKYPGKTLADLYDPEKMPYGLKQAHEFLDEVIDRIYRSKLFENDEERLALLFKLYEEMTEKEKQKIEKEEKIKKENKLKKKELSKKNKSAKNKLLLEEK